MRKKFFFTLLAAGAALCGCKKDSSASPKPTNTVGENPLTAPADYLGAASKAQKAAAKTVGMASLDQAIKMFSGQEGRLPKNLDELVSSGTLSRLPDAPNGMKFDYDPATGAIKVVPK
jgi:hypothetical protein